MYVGTDWKIRAKCSNIAMVFFCNMNKKDDSPKFNLTPEKQIIMNT